MITRSFLFLLAILTGFSAAEAANAAHSAPTSVGTSVAINSAPSLALAGASRTQAIAEIMAEPPRSVVISGLGQRNLPSHQILISYRVFRGERARE